MYAVVRTGGKQYRVEPGTRVRVELLNAEEGDVVQLDDVLFIADGDKHLAARTELADAKVTAKVTAQGRGKKVEIVKFRRRKHYRRQMGHRQSYTEIQITDIATGVADGA